MSESVKSERVLPAAYALGLLRGSERRELEARLAEDPGLRTQVEGWQAALVKLDQADSQTAPPGLFEKIISQIDGEGMQLPGTLTRRAASAEWIEYSEGIAFRVLKIDEQLKRRSLLVKMQPGAIYKSHAHDIDEECLVIEGDLRYGDLVLRAGDFHLATPAMSHPTGHTVSGCLLHVVVGMG